jgi:hypothetical protein
MSTSTSAPLSATTTEPNANTEPTVVETIEEAAFILEENSGAAILIQPKSVQF